MKKGKSRNKRKKTRSRLLWIAIAVIGIAAVISAVCVAGMLATKENAWKTPEELLVEYMDHIPKQEYEEMYAMLHIEASGNVSQEDFVTRNSAIYEGIEVQNMTVQIIAYDEEQMAVTYQTSFDTVAGTISFENEALFLKDEEGYKLVWDDSMIFPNLTSTDAEQVKRFCKMVDAKEKAEITIIDIDDLGGFIKYDLQTKDGNVDVIRSYYEYKDGAIQRNHIGTYQAEDWNYTEEGYLMFSGIYFSEELYALTLSGMEEHTALRVEPLDERCRELFRKYLLPISFERNNMFIVDWSEDDFGELNFYDMYDILYRKENGEYVPCAADDNLGVGAVYRIPKDEFESVIMKYFNIDSETLQSKTVYYSKDSTYEYKPRGFEEVEYPEYPYSEVVGFTENSDGTITLTANVVFPYSGNSKVYVHEVVVRALEDGGVQYVSNRIIPSEENCEETWHMPRLTAEEWEELYGGE